jgi:hypothetical protein
VGAAVGSCPHLLGVFGEYPYAAADHPVLGVDLLIPHSPWKAAGSEGGPALTRASLLLCKRSPVAVVLGV